MKKYLLLSSFLFLSLLVKAQNLVPNFGFEVHDTCPSYEDQAQYATGWNKCSGDNVIFIGNTTPDYFNSCAPSNGYGVPQSGNQYQSDLRACGAYMGLITYSFPTWSDYREQVGISLSQPLVIGQKYYLSFITVMGGHKIGTDYYDHPSNNIGMRLSTTAYSPSNPAPIDNFAHLRSVAVIIDTVNWIRISGSIVADSAYTYLMLGNFFDDVNTDTVMYNCSTCYNYYSYYLVDDICVSTDSLLANGGIDVIPCTVSVPEISSTDKISIFPNPTAEMITVSFLNEQSEEIILTNLFGEILNTEIVKGKSSAILNLSIYPSGIYILKIINQKGKTSVSKKIIKL